MAGSSPEQLPDDVRRELEHLRALVAKNSDWLWEIDESGVYTWTNPKVRDLLGYAPEEVLGKTPFAFMPAEEAERVAAVFAEMLAQRLPFREVLNVNIHHDGHLVVLETSGVPIVEHGVFKGYRGIDRDVTDRVRNEERLWMTDMVVKSAGEGIVVAGPDGRITGANPAFYNMTGVTEAQVTGQLPTMLLPGSGESRGLLWSALGDQPRWSGEGVGRHASGEHFPVWLTLAVAQDEARQVKGYIALVSDMTERRAAEATIRFQAAHDALTQLANRASFMSALDRAMATAQNTGSQVGVLFVDLDGFKNVNDAHGHGLGDLLLAAVARRLERCARRSDLVARFGGDEFTVLLRDLGATTAAMRVARNVVAQLNRPFRLHGIDLRIGASVGVATFPADGKTLDALIAAADHGMYRAKRAGGSQATLGGTRRRKAPARRPRAPRKSAAQGGR